jgi:translation initiation factor 2-alpha kinase 4
LYDIEAEILVHAYLNDIVEDRITAIFRLHGAVDMERPLLLPLSNPDESQNHATLIDRHGEMVCLPNKRAGTFRSVGFMRRPAKNQVIPYYKYLSAEASPFNLL